MSTTISIHSFRGGTGKSTISANIAFSLAQAGKKIGLIDTDIQSPGIHVMFGHKDTSGLTLNAYLQGGTPIEEVAIDVSDKVGLPSGSLHLIPCSMDLSDITRILKAGYDVGLLNKGFKTLRDRLHLDYLIIDTHPGLNEETLISTAISDKLLIIMRPDQQDFQGTSVTVDVSKRLKVEKIYIVVNKVLSYYDPEQVRKKVEQIYECPVAGVLPLSEKMVELASNDLFARRFPEEKWTAEIKKIVNLIGDLSI